MNVLYIDYTHSVPLGGAKVHGGANYTRTILINLIKHIEERGCKKRIVLLWPENYAPVSEIEKKIYDNKFFELCKINGNLASIQYEANADIFIPLLGVKEFAVLEKLKQKGLNIIMTIHGLRLMDYQFDSYNLKYALSAKEKVTSLIDELLLPLKQLAYRHRIKKYLCCINTLITVSNYTLSKLAEYINLKDVILQYEDTLPVFNADQSILNQCAERYMLFVSGNRPEKNLARTLDAFKQYQAECQNAIPMYIVGTNDKTRKALTRALKLEKFIAEKNIVFFDYVTDEELAALYSNAAFLVYTSKSEGFGLPALEAAKYGCPVMAAYGTSIPEVLGSNCAYVNPFSIESIEHGMALLSKEDQEAYFRSKIYSVYANSKTRMLDSNEIILRKLLSVQEVMNE